MALDFDSLPDAPGGGLDFDALPEVAPNKKQPAPKQPREIGFFEGAGRGAMAGYASGGRGLGDIFVGLPTMAADLIATGATEALRPAGIDLGYDHGLMEGYTRQWTKPLRRAEQFWRPGAGEALSSAGEVGSAVGNVASVLNTALLATPLTSAAAAPTAATLPGAVAGQRAIAPLAAQTAEGVALRGPVPAAAMPLPVTGHAGAARTLANVGAPGVVAMTPPAVSSGSDTFNAARQAGATPGEAMLPALASAGTTEAMGLIPIASGGNVLSRGVRGGALGVASAVPAHGIVQALLPEAARQPMTDEQLYTNAGMVALLSMLMGSRVPVATTREQINQEAFGPIAASLDAASSRAEAAAAKARAERGGTERDPGVYAPTDAASAEYRAIFEENRPAFEAQGITSFDDPRVSQMIYLIEKSRARKQSEPVEPGETPPRTDPRVGREPPAQLPDVIPLGSAFEPRKSNQPGYPQWAQNEGTAAGERAQREAEARAPKEERLRFLDEGAPERPTGKELQKQRSGVASAFDQPVTAEDYSGTAPRTLDDLANTRAAERMLAEIPGEGPVSVDAVRVLADEIARAEARRKAARTTGERQQIERDIRETALGLKRGGDAFAQARARADRKAADVFSGEPPFTSYQPGDAATSARRGSEGDVSVPGREAVRPQQFTFVGEVRGGKLVGDEVQLTGNTRTTGEGEGAKTEHEVVYIDREGQPVDWVPEEKVIIKSRPENPRYAQDVASRSSAPPAGVGKGTAQPAPRTSADRITPKADEGAQADRGMNAGNREAAEASAAERAQREADSAAALERDLAPEPETQRLERELAEAKADVEAFDAKHLPPTGRQAGRTGSTKATITDKNGRERTVRVGGRHDQDMEGDTLLDAIGRRGGLRAEDMSREGLDPADMAARNMLSVGYPPFSKNSTRTLDDLARTLADDGIVPPDTSPNDLLNLISDELHGGRGEQYRDIDANAERRYAERESEFRWENVRRLEEELAAAREREAAPKLELEQPTAEGLRARDEAAAARAAEEAAATRAAEQKAAADRDALDFRLQGSNRPSDKDANQGDMLGARQEPARTEAERWADADARIDALPDERVIDVARNLGVKTSAGKADIAALREQIKASELADVERALTPFYPRGQRGFINLAPLATAIEKAFKWATGDITSPAARREARALAQDMADAIGGVRSAQRITGRSYASDIFNKVFGSAEADLRSLGAASKSPTFAKLADLFHATAGRGEGVTRTFDESVQAERSRRMIHVSKQVSEVLAKHGLTADKAAYQRIVNLVENPGRARLGVEGQIARDIEAFLKEIHGYMRAAGVDVGEVKGYFPRTLDVSAVLSRHKQFLTAARDAYRAMGSTPQEAVAQADALMRSVLFGDAGRIGSNHGGTPAPNFTKSRVFNKQAYDILDRAGFYQKDLESVLLDYTHRAVTRAEIARRFGDGFKDWKATHDQILKEDPDAAGAMAEAEALIETMTGTRNPGKVTAGLRAMSAIRTWTTLATLEKATFSSLGEAILAPARASTGDAASFRQAWDNLALHADNVQRAVRRLPPSARVKAARDYAEDTGLIAGSGLANLQAARTGVDPIGRIQSVALAKFFERNGLSQWTNYARTTTALNGSILLRRLAKNLAAGEKKNAFFLRELGVPKGEEANFAAWLNGQLHGTDDLLPPSTAGKYGSMYNTAMLRFTDQVVMRPTAATRPAWASTPLGSTIFQLNSFNYAFQKNFLNRTARLGQESVMTKGKANGFDNTDAAYLGAMMALSGTAMIGVNMLVNEVREKMYGTGRPLTADAKVERAASRSGLLGTADPYVQAITGTKYDRPASGTFLGASVSNLSEVANTSAKLAAQALTGNAADVTTSQKRRAAKAFYGFVVEPAAQLGLTYLPVSPLTMAATVYGIPAMQDPFVNAVAGEKDYATRYREQQEPIRGLLGSVLAGDDRTPAERFRDEEKDRKKQRRIETDRQREKAGLPPVGAEPVTP